MDKDTDYLHNINKREIAIHLGKISNLHDYAIEVIKRYIKEFTNNPEFEETIVILKDFLIEVIKGKEQFIALGIEGIAKDIENFPYECTKANLPCTTTFGNTRFWKLYDIIQNIAFEEIDQGLQRTERTLWAIDILKAISKISSYYFEETIKSQLSQELLEELQQCLVHYIELWDKAINEIDKAIKICENDPEETYRAKKLQIGKKNMQLRSESPKMQGINHLIAILRENPISEKSRASLDITRGMEDLIGRLSQDKNHWTNLVMKAVDDVSNYHYSGFGFVEHKGQGVCQ